MSPKLTEMHEETYDVIIIGAGINGASAARELAEAGYSVLLADKGDFASGASSRSSRILHCGLRYFETHQPLRTFALHPSHFIGAIRMARAAMEARAELVERVPERCRPFTMCFPIYPESPVRGWHLDVGFRILQRLGPQVPPLDYRRLKSHFEKNLLFAHYLRDLDRLQSVASYREYIMDWPDRLCVDAALDAQEHGARILLFCEAHIRHKQDDVWSVELRDRDTGETAEIHARAVLNAAGTWIDHVNAGALAEASSPRLVRGTKGAHIAVRLPQAFLDHGIATLNRKAMPFYCLPSHDDCFYFGPTETPFDGDATDISASDEDIDFLLEEANHMFPRLGLTRYHVEFTWAGVRPLTFDVQQPMGRRTRELHDLAKVGASGVFAITAGPVMSHLSAGRELRQLVGNYLGAADHVAKRNSGSSPRKGFAISKPPGGEWRDVLGRCISQEQARDLKGVLYTRTGLAWRGHLDRSMIEDVATSIADLAGWSEARTKMEIDSFVEYQRTAFRNGSDPIQTGNQKQ